MKPKYRMKSIVLVVVSTLLTGCASTPPSRTYILSSLADRPTPRVSPTPLDEVAISIARVHIPKHLDRPSIVTQQDEVELAISEFHRWGQPLADNIGDVLQLNLTGLLPGSLVLQDRSFLAQSAAIIVDVQIFRLTGTLGAEAHLEAHWSLIRQEDKSLLSIEAGRYSQPLDSSEYAAYVTAVNQMVTDMSHDIAAAVRKAAKEM